MKKILCILTVLTLLCACGPAFSDVNGDTAALKSYARALKNIPPSLMQDAPESFSGKIVVAVFYSLSADPILYSPKTPEDSIISDIPEKYLAGSLSEADWAFLIYFDFHDSDPKESGPWIEAMVFPVNVKKGVFCKPYSYFDHETMLVPGPDDSFNIDPVISASVDKITPLWIEDYGADEEYRMGLEYMEDERYYSAYEAFTSSLDPRAEELAGSCIQPWPKNGEIWRDPKVKGTSMTLTFKVNQDSDAGFVALLYKKGVLVSRVFVHGTGSATVRLPGGNYVIKEGSGVEWFGIKQLFGPYGSYGTMTFDEQGTEEYYLEPGGTYQITINTADRDPDSKEIKTEYSSWDSVAE
ncbi:MAG: hypothetical protein IKI84_01325 [Clostridia bacterium]|nr:hypothetical protein [Clostridia bacterium]